MKKTINRIVIILLVGLTLACTDESKDPVKFSQVGKATYLALRGGSLDNLNDSGCSNSFFKNNITGDEVFTFDADFLSENQDNLSKVLVYANTTTIARAQVGTVDGSAFTLPSGAASKRGTVSVKLSDVMTALGLTNTTIANLKQQDLKISCDLELNDGTKILASAIINGSLFESVIFQPAMNLTYCANDKADFVPVASPSMLGKWGKTTDGKKVSRTKISLKSGAKDTLYIKFDKDIITAPTVTFDPAGAGTATALVKAKQVDENGFYTKDEDPSAFYLIYTAGGTYTGAVTATISGATTEVGGVVLTQDDKIQDINVDNTPPVVVSVKTGDLIGASQFVTMKVTFNEKLSTASADAIKVTVDGSARGLETVTDAKMTVSADGLSASLIYSFKLAVPTTPATHGPLTVQFTNAKDLAGNSTAILDGTLTVDVGTPPAPVFNPTYTDLGTQISWTLTQNGFSGGSNTGNVYFIAVAAGGSAPTGFSVDLDGNATWTGATNLQQGTVEVIDGDSANPAFTAFGANGTFDIYAVFVSSSGTKSAITVTPQLAGVVMN